MLPSTDFSVPPTQFVDKYTPLVVEASPWAALAGAVLSQVLVVRHNQRIAAVVDRASTAAAAADLALQMSETAAVAVVEILVDCYWPPDCSIQYFPQMVARSAKS